MKITFDKKKHSDDTLISLYRAMLKPRMIEDKMLVLLRQGKISKWFSGYGQEAISVGVAEAIAEDEYILPMHRNLGVFTSRNVPLDRLFSQFQGKMNGFTKGRDRSFHFGTQEHKIVGMISHLGPQMGIADGIALGNLLKENNQVTAVFTGDGGASEGDFHEAINVASVWDLPVIFIIENNCWGLSTPSVEQFRCKQFIDKAIGYGIEGIQVNGNNILEVYEIIKSISNKIRRKPRPFILECMTFRMRGHEEASGTKYYPEGLQDEWAEKDPLRNYEEFLLKTNVLDEVKINEFKQEIKQEIEEGLNLAFKEESVKADTSLEYQDIYFGKPAKSIPPATNQSSEKRFIDALSDGLHSAMERHDNLILMGQDVAEYGGVFKVTEGFVKDFGKQRVRNTPLCESAIVGAGLGLSINDFKAVVEMQFADFVTCGFNQVVNNLAKIHWRWGQNADVVVRMPTGAGVGAGPYHSQSNEAWFFHVPGLKIVYPAFPSDAKGLLLAAIGDPNPVMYFEHKALYRSITGDVPDDYYTIEIGKANLVKEGIELSIITYGYGVHWALSAVEELGLDADILDLRTLLPFDKEAIIQTTVKTGKVIILHEDTLTGGIGAEISAFITENCFENLDAPVIRVASLDTPVPFASDLERNFLPIERFELAVQKLRAY